MDWYQIVLRLVHIMAGAFWAGSFYFFFFFVEPSVEELGPTGQQFVAHLEDKRKLSKVLSAAAGLTILAGILLYWRDSDGFSGAWISSGPGIAFTIGGAAAIFAFAAGFSVIRPTVARMGEIGREIGGGPPGEAHLAEIQRLSGKLKNVGRVVFVLITIALATMATARFW